MNPICSKCEFLTNKAVRFRPCAKIPIFHKDMLCSSEENMIKDRVTGESYTPYCEEVNRHGECLAYRPIGLHAPVVVFCDEYKTVGITSDSPLVVVFDNKELSARNNTVGSYDEEMKKYFYSIDITHSCIVKAASVEDGVMSNVTKMKVEIPDIPEIEFDKTTNTVSIKSYNTVRYTTDDSPVTENSPLYEGPFIIDHNTNIKCRSYCKEDYSIEVSKYCISIEPPVILFEPETNKVSIEADDTVLFSTDGSDIFDDSSVYEEPIELTKNTLVKAACMVDGELSEIVEKECLVANPPEIIYDEKTHKVTIKSENPIRYTIDGSTPKKSSKEYTVPFTISESVVVKAISVTEVLSTVSELECVFVSPPEIRFDPDTNTVSITGENKILFSTDGSKIYDDSDEYLEAFEIEKNTTVKAACILNGVLSDEVTLICKVPSIPKITFDSRTKTVTISSDNPVIYTTDGSDVKKKDAEYKAPFKIVATTTVKAKSIVDNKLSEQAELLCSI